jgi:NitT/TauT family transport system permease protein
VQKYLKTAAIVVFWLVVWEMASQSIAHDLILVSPLQVLARLSELVLTSSFWLTVLQSFGRIVIGFMAATIVGVLLAAAAGRFALIGDFLAPLMLTVKSIPVASFIILVLIWVVPANLSIIISFLMVLPLIYTNVLKGIQQTDPQLLEMANVFRISRRRRLRYVYLSQVLPYFISGCTVALGLCWKAGIAAEIIGLPDESVGEMLYLAKLYLNTTDIFAWTLVIVLISLLFEKVFLVGIQMATKRLEKI